MSNESRLDRLERAAGLDGRPRAAVVVYDPREEPQDPAQRDAWLRSQRPPDAAVVFFMPDNRRGRQD